MKKRSFTAMVLVGLLLSSPVLTTVGSTATSQETVGHNPQPVPPAPVAKIPDPVIRPRPL